MADNNYTETYENILADLVPQTPGIIRSVALRELRLAIREFFEKSYAWTTIIESINASAGEVDIVLDDSDANTQIVGILSVVKTTGVQLVPLAKRPVYDLETSDDPKFFFVTENPDHIRLYPFLENAQTAFLDVTVALIPNFTVSVLPRQITLKYYDAIVNGYLARVYIHPNKPYSAPALAGHHRHKFLREIGYYAAQRKQGFNQSQHWAYPTAWRK